MHQHITHNNILKLVLVLLLAFVLHLPIDLLIYAAAPPPSPTCCSCNNTKNYPMEYFEKNKEKNDNIENTDAKPLLGRQSWPKFEFMVPINYVHNEHVRNMEFVNIFLRSLLLYWPVAESKLVVNMIIDEECIQSQSELVQKDIIALNTSITSEFNNSEIPLLLLVPNSPREGVWDTGHDRQQYLMFYPENFTTGDYVGFSDADTMFHSNIDVSDIFSSEGKPVIHGKMERITKKSLTNVYFMLNSLRTIGNEQFVNCMSYFPIVFKVSHFKNMREHITKQFRKQTFEEAFKLLSHGLGGYSQFCMFCTYMFWFHMQDYSWSVSDLEPWWDGNNPRPYNGQWSNKRDLPSYVWEPRSYIAEHYSHRIIANKIDLIGDKFVKSLCWAHPKLELVVSKYSNSMGLSIYDKFKATNCTDLIAKSLVPYFDEQFIFENQQMYPVFYHSNCSSLKQAFDARNKYISRFPLNRRHILI